MLDLDAPRAPGRPGDRVQRREWIGGVLPSDREVLCDQPCVCRVRLGREPAQGVDVGELDRDRPGEPAPFGGLGRDLAVHREHPEGACLQGYLHAVGGPDQPGKGVERAVRGLHAGTLDLGVADAWGLCPVWVMPEPDRCGASLGQRGSLA